MQDYKNLPYYSYDYQRIEDFCISQCRALQADNIGLIIGILRGGGVPALMLSQLMALPVHFIRYNRHNATPVPEFERADTTEVIKQTLNEGKRVLLVEDMAGVGYTLQNCKNALLDVMPGAIENDSLKVMTLFYHDNSRLIPDYGQYLPDSRAVLPWERYVTNHLCHADFDATGQALAENEKYRQKVFIQTSTLNLLTQVDYQILLESTDPDLLDKLKHIGPEAIYCHDMNILLQALDVLPFVLAYYLAENGREYRISNV